MINKKIILTIISTIGFILLIIVFAAITNKNNQNKSSKNNLVTPTQETPTENIYEENIENESLFYQKNKKETTNIKENPLGKYMPYYGEHFEINYSGKIKNGIPGYKVKLYVILNRPSQFEQYKEKYLKYKIEALDWIKSKGVDYTKLDIEWEPEDPKNINFNQESEIYPEEKTCKTCQ